MMMKMKMKTLFEQTMATSMSSIAMVGIMAHSTIPDVTAIDQPFAVLLLPDAVEVVGKWVNRSSTEEQHTVDCASMKMDYKKMTIHEDGCNLK